MDKESVVVEIDGAIASITVNRPESLNALNVDVLQALINALGKIQADPSIRVLSITGQGEKAFVAGADIATMNELGPRPIADYVELGQRAMRSIECLRMPVIASVNGYALGGGLELALSCDIIIGSDAAKVGQPEVNLGIIPGFGGTQRLIHRCGIGAARRLCFTGDIIGASEALQIGLLDIVVPHAELKAETRKLCERIASKAPLAVAGAKSVIRRAGEETLLSGLRHEVESFLHLFQTADREEGMSAFLQKRQAKFTGR